MNTILIFLKIVVIYLIHISSNKKENYSPGFIINNMDCSNVTMADCSNPWIQDKCKTECAKDTNSLAQCREWAFRPSNECEANPDYMLANCAKACEEKKIFDNEINKLIKNFNLR